MITNNEPTSLDITIKQKPQMESVNAPNYDLIKSEVQNLNSDKYYPVLYERIQKCDPTLTPQDYQYIYYGYLFSDRFLYADPYSNKSEAMFYLKKKNKTLADRLKIIDLLEDACEEYLFDLGKNNLLATMYQEINESQKQQGVLNRINNIIDAVLRSGDGKTKETGMHVTSVTHEYIVTNVRGLKRKKQEFLDNKYDRIEVTDNSGADLEIYFNIEQLIKKKAR